MRTCAANFIVFFLAAIFLLQWFASYQQIEAVRASMVETTRQVSMNLERQRLALQAGFAGLAAKIDEARDAVRISQSALPPATHADIPDAAEDSELSLDVAGEEATESEVELHSLPPLPADFDAPSYLRRTNYQLAELLADPLVNPDDAELTRVGRLEALELLTTAYARAQILESQIQSGLARDIELLRERGDYIEYPKESHPPPEGPGVMTAAEKAENGMMRIFYFHEDEFPEPFAKKRAIRAEAEMAVRGVAGILRDG